LTRIDPGVVLLLAELRGQERQAAEELDQKSQALNRLRAMVSLPKYSPPMPRPRQATADGWRSLAVPDTLTFRDEGMS
jgi:hypothetical protein